MRCIILLPDASGRLPSVQELRLRGFIMSAAVEQPEIPGRFDSPPPTLEGSSGLALAAEEPARYGAAPSLER